MKGKTGGLLALILGVVLIGAGLVVRFVILPGQAQWPEDVDTTRTYEGTLQVMLNPQALQNMDLANLFVRDIPLTITRHVTTEEVEGGKAIVKEVATMAGPGGQEIQTSEEWYAIDRKTMEAISDFSGNDKVIDRKGLVIGWPIGTEKIAYPGWNGDTLSTVTVEYVREEERGGLNTFVFEASAPAQQIVNPEKLARFPAAIPKDLLVRLAQTLDVPDALKERLAAILPDLPDPVPLNYTYEYEATYWIEPTTGVLVDATKHELRQVALQIEGLPRPVPITPVFEFTYQTTPASVEDAAADASEAKSTLDTFGTLVPAALIGLGLLVGLVGLVMLRR